ncbi:unnamed protein product [Arctogadus glacialis]
MDEEREEGGPTSKTILSGEHGGQSKAKSLGWAVFIGDVRPRREQPAYRRKGMQNSTAAQSLTFVRIGT